MPARRNSCRATSISKSAKRKFKLAPFCRSVRRVITSMVIAGSSVRTKPYRRIHSVRRTRPAGWEHGGAAPRAFPPAALPPRGGGDRRGKPPPLTRQLFVLPFAFTARVVGKVLALCRPRLEFFSHINEP